MLASFAPLVSPLSRPLPPNNLLFHPWHPPPKLDERSHLPLGSQENHLQQPLRLRRQELRHLDSHLREWQREAWSSGTLKPVLPINDWALQPTLELH